MDRIKVSAVSYLNTKPFLYGIFQSDIQNRLEVTLDIPSVCAAKLKSGEADLGLVPVAIIPELNSPHVISDYCIGSVGKVKTVCIYSEVPIQQVKNLYLDYHSRTSVALTKVLLEKYWRVNPLLMKGTEGYIENIANNTAGLVIGDRTIGLEKRFPFVYDLGEAWMAMTGLPFVFAAWVSNRKLPEDFVEDFNEALKTGLAHIPQLIYILPTEYFDFDLTTYFTKHISYNLDDAKKQGLRAFLRAIESRVELVV